MGDKNPKSKAKDQKRKVSEAADMAKKAQDIKDAKAKTGKDAKK